MAFRTRQEGGIPVDLWIHSLHNIDSALGFRRPSPMQPRLHS